MKKFILCMVTVLLLCSCFGLGVFASPASATISDDCQEIYWKSNAYLRFNTSRLTTDYEQDVVVELSEQQQETINNVSLSGNDTMTMLVADIYYKDGSVLTAKFLREDYVETYENMLTEDVEMYIIDFQFPKENTLSTEKAALFAEKVTLSSEKLEWCGYYFPVISKTEDKSITAYHGALISIERDYYYVDFRETLVESWDAFDPYNYTELSAYAISDNKLLENIESCMEHYYSEDFGFLFNDKLTETISLIFLILMFCIIPFAIFVVFLILAIRSKTIYKKMFRWIYLLSIAELIVFAIVTVLLMSAK